MSEIHYFQRYTTAENAVTNNTLHLLGRVYEYSPARLRALFTQMFEQDDIELGVRFRQQSRSRESVPDGVLSQAAVHIAIETKVTAGIDLRQLSRHLRGVPDSGRRFLLLLTKENAGEKALDGVRHEAIAHGIAFQHLTFERLCQLLDENVKAYETTLRPVIDDYLTYCIETGLRKTNQYIMRVVPCGPSHPLNERHNLYFHPQDRGYSPFRFLGIYYGKSVRQVGEVVAVVDADMAEDGELCIRDTEGRGIAGCAHARQIRECMADAQRELGWDISKNHRFFCVSQFFPTTFSKSSSGGIMGPRNRDFSKEKPKDAAALANTLRGRVGSSRRETGPLPPVSWLQPKLVPKLRLIRVRA